MLPIINSPVFDVILPVSKKAISYRPFLIKEQKVLLMAAETEDKDFLIRNIKEIIKNCCITPIDFDKLPTIDVEFLFLQLRARSVGEVVETKYRCENYVEEKEGPCWNLMDVSYNILETTIDAENYIDDIKLTNTVGVKMKFPDYNSVRNIAESKPESEIIFEVIKNCIDYIYDENNVYYISETPEEEVDTFLESLNIEQFQNIQKYFDCLPTLEKKINVTCSKCNFEHEIVIKGIKNFFD